jgi:hypothetical protein
MCTDETPGRRPVARQGRHVDPALRPKAAIRVISSLAMIAPVTNVLGAFSLISSELQKTFVR